MSATGIAAIALATGGLLGTIFFGGLWCTVRHGLTAAHPAVWFTSSLLLRSGVILVGFYLVSARGLAGLMACLFGFLIARAAVTRFTLPASKSGHAT